MLKMTQPINNKKASIMVVEETNAVQLNINSKEEVK
jgi:hypothetical protein